MPNIRFMTWNIQQLSGNKAAIAGMANNIARVIVDAQADVVIILELTSGTGPAALNAVSVAANGLAPGGGNDYTGRLVSFPTGGELYGVLIRNLNQVRPIAVVPVPGQPTGADDDPLGNLDRSRFATWPGPFLGAGAVANAYPLPMPRPPLPLTDVYASSRRPRVANQRARFAGRSLARGGYSVGRGFRMPCLAMFEILNGAGAATYVVPILVCHLGAVRSGANRLARGQIRQYKDVHISQKFQNSQALLLPFGGYIDLNNVATPIQELMVTGDFNVDFLQQNPPPPASALRTGNRNAWNTITPTTTAGGSAAPAALSGAPNPYNPFPPPVALAAPITPFGVIAGPAGPSFNTIPNLALKTADTHQGTILIDYVAGVVPPNLAALRGAGFDNCFFGGTQLSATYQNLTPMPAPADAVQVVDLPAQIVQAGGGGAGALDVSGAWTYHMIPPVTRNAAAAPNLGPGAAPAMLTTNDRLIGARFISDHLPVVVQFNLP